MPGSASDRLRVVADTGPVNYLVLIGQAGVLPDLFGGLVVAEAVWRELTHPATPEPVRAWIARPPAWLSVRADPGGADPGLEGLSPGERESIRLARTLPADLIVMDDRAGVAAARARGLAVTGTTGLLDLAARRRLIDVFEAVERLRGTSFRCRPEMLSALRDRHRPP